VPEAAAAPAAAEPGFLFYIAGDAFLMSMPALPAAGTVWSLRTYQGTIVGAPGAYTYTPPNVRSFTALGATSALEFGVSSTIANATSSDLSRVHTVPDPYYVKSAYEASTEQKVLKFVGLPARAIIRIYSVSGVLVRMLEHDGTRYSSTSRSQGSEFDWDLRNRNNQVVASGVYFYHIEAGDARRVGRFTVVNFAQ
jgi:predicted secreted protein